MTNVRNKYNNDRIRMTSYQKVTEIPITSSGVGFLCYATCCRDHRLHTNVLVARATENAFFVQPFNYKEWPAEKEKMYL
jgi:hypothetical protein